MDGLSLIGSPLAIVKVIQPHVILLPLRQQLSLAISLKQILAPLSFWSRKDYIGYAFLQHQEYSIHT